MEEKTLFKIAIATSLVGLLILVIMAETLSSSDIRINDINHSHLDHNVKITGILAGKKDYKGIAIFNITDDSSSINAVMYKKAGKFSSSEFKKGDVLEIVGFVKEYNKALEIEASSIKKKQNPVQDF